MMFLPFRQERMQQETLRHEMMQPGWLPLPPQQSQQQSIAIRWRALVHTGLSLLVSSSRSRYRYNRYNFCYSHPILSKLGSPYAHARTTQSV